MRVEGTLRLSFPRMSLTQCRNRESAGARDARTKRQRILSDFWHARIADGKRDILALSSQADCTAITTAEEIGNTETKTGDAPHAISAMKFYIIIYWHEYSIRRYRRSKTKRCWSVC